MTTTKKIRTEPFLDGQGLHIVLDDPKGNVLDGQMMGELSQVLDSLEGRPETTSASAPASPSTWASALPRC